MVGLWMNNELKSLEVIVVQLRQYHGTWIEGKKKTMKNSVGISSYPDEVRTENRSNESST
jgi:hypothetical protein